MDVVTSPNAMNYSKITDMSQSTGPISRDDFEGVNGVVLPNETVGDMILTFFVDLNEDIIFVVIGGGMESLYFKLRGHLVLVENIDKVCVELSDYVEGINFILDEVGEHSHQDVLPPVPQMRDSLLTRARVKRSQSTN